MSRYFTDAGYLERRRLTNTRLVATAAAALVRDIDQAFESVQSDIDAGSGGGGGPLIFSYSASAMWIVNHNLGRTVSVDVVSSGGAKIGAEVLQVSPNQVRVYFEVPVPGKVLIR